MAIDFQPTASNIDFQEEEQPTTFGLQNVPDNLQKAGQYALGAYSGAMNPVFGLATLLNKGINKATGSNIPLPQKREISQSAAYQAGQPLGEMAAYGAMTAIPGAGAIPTLARLGGGALYGAAMSPYGSQNAGEGALEGADTQMALELLPKGAQMAFRGISNSVPKALDFMRPKKYLSEVMQQLGGGKNVNDISSSLAGDIKESAKGISEKYKEILKPVQDQASGYNLYQSKAGFVPNTYKPLAKEYEGSYLGDAKILHKDFLENPTFDNAHKLQSQLGAEARGLKGADVATNEARQKLTELRSALKNDIHGFLNKQDITGGLTEQYKKASDYYLNEYVPYKNIKTLTDVLGKKGATSTSLLGAFKNPKLTAEAGGNLSDALKVANDLGDMGKNKIIALDLAKKNSLTPKKALESFNNLETSGLSEYKTQSLEDAMKSLKSKQTAKKVAQIGAAAAGLSALGFPIHKILGAL